MNPIEVLKERVNELDCILKPIKRGDEKQKLQMVKNQFKSAIWSIENVIELGGYGYDNATDKNVINLKFIIRELRKERN